MPKPNKEVKKLTKRKAAALVRTYTTLHKKLGRAPTANELDDAGFSRDAVRHNVGSMRRLDALAREEHPTLFYDVDLTRAMLGSKQLELDAVLNSYQKFVITTNVLGCPIDKKFFAAIKNYCQLNDAALLILVTADPAKRNTPGGYGTIDRALVNENIVLQDVELNDNLRISSIKVSAKQADPTTSLERIGGRHQSCILASPKQRLKLVPTSNVGLPLALMTTGSINRADYGTDRYLSERTAVIAASDHVTGALIVEIESRKMYHYRQTQARSDGSFIDLGVRYTGATTESVDAAALVPGDWHAGSVSDCVRSALPEMCKTLSPKMLVMHDIMDSMAVNGHETDQTILRAQRAEAGQLNLTAELRTLKDDLAWLTTLAPQVAVVASNHNDMVDRSLQSGRYVNDPYNLRVSLKLSLAMLDGKDPVVEGVKLVAGDDRAFLKKVRFLKRDEDLIIAGVAVGNHGDLGGNGARGSAAGIEKAYGSAIVGHTHTPNILRNVWTVGTSSHLRLTYTRGASSWLNAMVVLYSCGTRQMINIINGKWKL